MVLKNQDVSRITEYLFSSKVDKSKKYLAAKDEKAVVNENKNVELVEELLNLQDLIKRERGKITDLEQQINDHKGLTDLQYYQQYIRACVADNYGTKTRKKVLLFKEKREI